MKIGYIRVSTEDQNTARQEVLPHDLGVNELFIDKASGKNADRPELNRMMEYIRHGNTVIVESISRFARNTRDLLDLVERLTEKEVEFVSRKEAIDTTTPTGKFMLTVFAAVAELEREYILQRQCEGITIAKEQGKYTGCKPLPLPDNFERVVARWRTGEITATEAMRQTGLIMGANIRTRLQKSLPHGSALCCTSKSSRTRCAVSVWTMESLFLARFHRISAERTKLTCPSKPSWKVWMSLYNGLHPQKKIMSWCFTCMQS